MASSVFIDPSSSGSSAPSASFIPTADNAYDLGSASFQFRSAYLGTSAILASAGTVNWTDLFLSRLGANSLGVGSAAAGITGNVSLGKVTQGTLALTTTSTDGLISQNLTPALVGTTVQYSPRLRFSGTAWKSNATAASQTNQLIQELRPATGAAATAFTFVWAGAAAGAGSFTDLLSLNSAGSLLASDGSAASPTYSFASAPTIGMYTAAGAIRVSISGAQSHLFDATAFYILDSAASILFGASQDVALKRIAADVLGLQRSTNLQTFRVYDSTGTGYTAYGGTGISTYRNVATAGWGVPAIQAAGRVTAQSAANASISTYTVGAADGSFEISANMNVTVVTTLVTTLTCTYTDEGNTARTMVLPVTQLSGSFIAAGAITGLGAWETPKMHIRCKAATAITILTSAGTFTGVTYTAEGIIQQIA